MRKLVSLAAGLLLLVLLVLFSTTYTVRFHEVAVKTTFGRISQAKVEDEPGVHFRLPLFADRVTKYDKRLQYSETALVEVATADGQSVVVKAYLMWRVDPEQVLTFAESFPKAMADADPSVTDVLHTAVKGSLGRYAFDDLIGPGSQLAQAEDDIRGQLASLGGLGIQPATVGISQVKLPPKVSKAVLARMSATRQTLAEAERNAGTSRASAIEAEANRTADLLRAFAEQRAEEIKGQANEKAAVYLRQMSEDEDFAIFLVWLDALEAALGLNTTFFVSDEAAPWHLLNLSGVLDAGHIPQPQKEEFRLSRRTDGPAAASPGDAAPPGGGP